MLLKLTDSPLRERGLVAKASWANQGSGRGTCKTQKPDGDAIAGALGIDGVVEQMLSTQRNGNHKSHGREAHE